MRLIQCALLLIFSIYSSSVIAVYKCVDVDGKTSYQDKKCDGDVNESKIPPQYQQDIPVNYTYYSLTIKNGKTFGLELPDSWSAEQFEDEFNIITLTAKPKDEDLLFLVSVQRIREDLMSQDDLYNKSLNDLKSIHKNIKTEKLLTERRLDPIRVEGKGVMLWYVDKKLAQMKSLPEDEYIFTCSGFVVLKGSFVTFTVLGNKLNSDNFIKAITTIKFHLF